MKTIAVYSRKSKFTCKGESTKNQIAICRNYIEHTLGETNAEVIVYEDEGFSGKTLDRPAFSRMMSDGEKGKFSYLLVYRLDRISRNISDFAKLTEKLELLGIKFISVKENFDTSTPTGRAMMYISSVFSQLERETISERIRDSMKELAKSGRWLGGISPFGYSSIELNYALSDRKNRKMYGLTDVPAELEIVRIIFRKYMESGSITYVKAYLNERRFVTRRGKPFSGFTIKNILSNPVYMRADEAAYEFLMDKNVCIYSDKSQFDGSHGLAVYNRTLQRKGKANRANPYNIWIASVGMHRGIISGKDWIYANSILEKRSRRKTPSVTGALLSGILFCGKCLSPMRPKTNGKSGFYYVCTGKEKSRRALCSAGNANGKALDDAILSAVFELDEDFLVVGKKISDYKERLEESDTETASPEKRIAENNARIKNLLEIAGRSEHSKDCILEELEVLCRENREIEEKIKSAENHSVSKGEIEILLSFRSLFEKLSLEEKKIVLGRIVKEVKFENGKAYIEFHAEKSSLRKNS